VRVIDTIVTEMAYLRVTQAGLVLEEIGPALTVEDVQRATQPTLMVSPQLRTMETQRSYSARFSTFQHSLAIAQSSCAAITSTRTREPAAATSASSFG
jgi:acyl CoA:acetate/3-ketoacid CoA transferase